MTRYDRDRPARLALALGPCRTPPAEVDPLEEIHRRWPHRQRHHLWRSATSIDGLLRAMERLQERLRSLKARAVLVSDADYPPALLNRDPAAPAVLFVQGQLPDPAQRHVALVGTRGALIRNLERARELAAGLVSAGLGVVSGGALGVDAAAHEGALEACGTTIAVLGSGLDIRYPERNTALFDRIAERGALVSSFPPGTPPRRPNFPRRNRIIAGWVEVVVVVEAPARSGALNTARWARELQVPLLALPEGAGARGLLGRGAGQIVTPSDILAVVRGEAPRTGVAPGDPDQREALRVLRETSLSVDGLATRLGWTVSRAAATLIRLELAGLALAEPGGRYRWNASL